MSTIFLIVAILALSRKSNSGGGRIQEFKVTDTPSPPNTDPPPDA